MIIVSFWHFIVLICRIPVFLLYSCHLIFMNLLLNFLLFVKLATVCDQLNSLQCKLREFYLFASRLSQANAHKLTLTDLFPHRIKVIIRIIDFTLYSNRQCTPLKCIAEGYLQFSDVIM